MLVIIPLFNIVNQHIKITAGNIIDQWKHHLPAPNSVRNIDHAVFKYVFRQQSAVYGDVFWP